MKSKEQFLDLDKYVLYLVMPFIEVYGNATPAAAPKGPKYQHFDNTPRRILGRQNYNPFRGSNIWIVGDVINPVNSLPISASL